MKTNNFCDYFLLYFGLHFILFCTEKFYRTYNNFPTRLFEIVSLAIFHVCYWKSNSVVVFLLRLKVWLNEDMNVFNILRNMKNHIGRCVFLDEHISMIKKIQHYFFSRMRSCPPETFNAWKFLQKIYKCMLV